jgi:predicted dehydrogenase
MAGAWLKPAAGVPGLEIVGLVDIKRENAARRRGEFGLAKAAVGDDLKAMLKSVKPDIVFDVTVPGAHCGVVTEALKHGCHVLGEKPMADSMASARRMVEASRKARRIYAVTQNYRYNPQIRSFQRFLAKGGIGDITTVHCDFFIGPHFGGFREQMDHVLLLDMAIHTFDATRFISGQSPRSVYAVDWNPKGSWFKHGASAVAVFEMTGGVVATYRGSWCAEGLSTPWNSHWRVLGTRGSATWDGADGLAAQVPSRKGGFQSKMTDAVIKPLPASQVRHNGHEALIREFVSCIRNGTKPQTVCTDNIHSLAMVFGAIESAESGRRVPVKA